MTKKNYLKLFNYFFFVFVVMLISTFVFLTIDFSANSYSTWIDEGNYNPYLLKGEGTYSSPYLVSSAEDLASIAYFVNNNSSTYKNKYFVLTQNIDLSKHEWVPISPSNSVRINFDGLGYVISGLKITKNYTYTGLFGSISGAVLDLRVSGEIKSASSQYVGGIVAYTENASILRCVSNVKINCSNANYVGGIAGYAGEYNNITESYNLNSIVGKNYVGGIAGHGMARNCYNNGDVTGTDYVGGVIGRLSNKNFEMIYSYNRGVITGTKYVGGITGYASRYISNCFNSGSVNKTANATASHMGGIAGITSEPIEDCSNSANINGNSIVGGIVGLTTNKLFKCYNNGTVGTTSTRPSTVGGIVGKFEILGNTIDIQQCFNSGWIYGNEEVGGIAGFTTANIFKSANTGLIYGITYVGGIVGYFGPRVDTINDWRTDVPDLRECYNTGNIGGYSSTDQISYAGGIAGVIHKAGIVGCYNRGNISSAHSNCGGIVGLTWPFKNRITGKDDQSSAYRYDPYCNRNYTTGKIESSTKTYIGAVIGRNTFDYGSTASNFYVTKYCNPNMAYGNKKGKGVDNSRGQAYKLALTDMYGDAMKSELTVSTQLDYFVYNTNALPTLKNAVLNFRDIKYEFNTSNYGTKWKYDNMLNNGYPVLANNYWI